MTGHKKSMSPAWLISRLRISRVTWKDLGQRPKEGKGQHTEAMAKMMSSNGAAARQHCTNHKSIQGTIPARDQFFLSQNRLWGGF